MLARTSSCAWMLWGVIVARYWTLMRDAVVVVREERVVYGFFEDFYVRSQRWFDGGAFRSKLARLARDPALARGHERPAIAE